jgi:hypothetical protein
MYRKSVQVSEWLYRRSFSSPERKYMNPDGSAHSRVFKLRPKDKGELSVNVKSLTTVEATIVDFEKYILFEIFNDDVYQLGLECFHDPLPDGSNNAHAAIIGMTNEDDIMPGKLARKSRRVFI